jgi:hypothetical protein
MNRMGMENCECRISSFEWRGCRARRLIRVSNSEGIGRYRKPTEGLENFEWRIANVEWSQNPEFRSQESEFYLATDETQIEHGWKDWIVKKGRKF